MTIPENFYTQTSKFACDGDKDSSHPRVFLTVNTEGWVECGYCSKRYVLVDSPITAEAH